LHILIDVVATCY